MSLTIRPMMIEDVNRVYEIEKNVHRAPWSYNILKDCVYVGYDCRVLETSETDLKAAIGYIIARYNLNNCHILNFCIDKPYQRKGYGKYLMSQFLNTLNKANIDSISLEVRPSNIPALKLYDSLGFIEVEIKEDYYMDEDSKEDAILLMKSIF